MMEAAPHSQIADHYARGSLVAGIRDGLAAMGKTESTVTAEDLSPVDEFHIGGRAATGELAGQLALTAADRVLDIGCGLGGPARQIAAKYGCHLTGIDLTRDYVEAGNVLSGWLHLGERVSLQQGDALRLPFPDGSFTAAYMLHVGMNIADKSALFFGHCAGPMPRGAFRCLRRHAHWTRRTVLSAAMGEYGRYERDRRSRAVPRHTFRGRVRDLVGTPAA
ncbi:MULTISPECIES: methyltransferase domain-containing protein [unclassified Mesorhizobium]|uniref:methyltransferase domain-containing protein n=1 Tax=Mesorhizobium sp. B2-6-6 TaxID=2589911 RepID=UPI0015E3B10F